MIKAMGSPLPVSNVVPTALLSNQRPKKRQLLHGDQGAFLENHLWLIFKHHGL
jgi:hypothetical protein